MGPGRGWERVDVAHGDRVSSDPLGHFHSQVNTVRRVLGVTEGYSESHRCPGSITRCSDTTYGTVWGI